VDETLPPNEIASLSEIEAAELASPETATSAADQAGAEAEYERYIWANLRRNYVANYLQGMLGMTGFRLVNAPTFVPAYLFILAQHSLASCPSSCAGSPAPTRSWGSPFAATGRPGDLADHRRLADRAPQTHPAGLHPDGTLMRVQVWHGRRRLVPGRRAAPGRHDGLPLAARPLLGAQRVAFQLVLGKVIPFSRAGGCRPGATHRRDHRRGPHYAAGRYIIGNGAISIPARFLSFNVFKNGYSTTFFIAFA